MSLMRGNLFRGALFAGALFGISAPTVDRVTDRRARSDQSAQQMRVESFARRDAHLGRQLAEARLYALNTVMSLGGLATHTHTISGAEGGHG